MSRKYFSLTHEVAPPASPPTPMPHELRNGRLLDPRRAVRLLGVSQYLAVSPAVARAIVADRAITRHVGGRYDLRDLWLSLWGIGDVPGDQIPQMSEPLVTVTEVAQLAGVSERTIRRAGDSRSLEWSLPPHVDLGPRVRRYLRPLVAAWALQTPPDAWLMPAPRRAILGGSLLLRGRAGGQTSTIGQNTNQPTK